MVQIQQKMNSLHRLSALTELLYSYFNAGVLVTKVTKTQQIILSNTGQPLPLHLQAAQPIQYSMCKHTADMKFPMAVSNVGLHPFLKDNLTYSELGILAYLGAPIHEDNSRKATGGVCALDTKIRKWTDQDIAMIILASKTCDRILQSNNTELMLS